MNNQFQTHKEWKGVDQESNNPYPRFILLSRVLNRI
jgi:hypothetical protein